MEAPPPAVRVTPYGWSVSQSFGYPTAPAVAEHGRHDEGRLSRAGTARMSAKATGDKGRSVVVASGYSPRRNGKCLEQIVARLSIEPDMTSLSWETLPA